MGPATAKKIIAGRPYSSVDDLAKAGISAKIIDGVRPMVTVGAATAAAEKPAAEPKAAQHQGQDRQGRRRPNPARASS